MKSYVLALALAVVMTGSAQAASAPVSGAAAPKAAVTAAPARKGLSDAQIERDIRARFARSKMTLVGKEKFTVSVKDGVATLEGKTNVIQHKGVATRLARLGGAIAVQNRIEISEEARARAAAKLAKARGVVAGAPARAKVVP